MERIMGYYLLENPNPNLKQFLTKRRTTNHGGQLTGAIILHDAEGGTDLVGVDMGAENVARFIATRTTYGSYHVLVDRDSTIPMVPYEYEAFHDTTSNNYSVGISVAWNKADLSRMTRAQRDSYYVPFARAVIAAVGWFRARGIAVPTSRFLSRAEVIAGKPGISTHSRMDPSRRSDPFGTGSTFESEFLAVLANLMPTSGGGGMGPVIAPITNPTTPVPEEDDMFDDTAREKLDLTHYAVNSLILPATARVEVKVNALGAAVEAMGQSLGLDPGVITKTVEDAVTKALANIEVTVTSGGE